MQQSVKQQLQTKSVWLEEEGKKKMEVTKQESTSSMSVSVSPKSGAGGLSEVIAKIAKGDKAELVVLGRGSQSCKELIKKGQIKEGHIICMARSFKHHLHVTDDGSFARGLLLTLTNFSIADGFVTLLGRKELREKGQDDSRDIGYMHMAIYVGQTVDKRSKEKKYWVTENAGGKGPTSWGRIELKELDASFDDFANDDSAFIVISPFNSRMNTQQNALATVGMRYKYNVKWFNCEAYTSLCAGFYSKEAKDANINPDHMKRVLFRERPEVDAETLELEREFWLNPFKDKMLNIFSEKKSEIDGQKYKLDAVLEEYPPNANTH